MNENNFEESQLKKDDVDAICEALKEKIENKALLQSQNKSINSTQYDGDLKNILFYLIHPEMLPFIGSNYHPEAKEAEAASSKVLLVGDNYFMPHLSESDQNDWYASAPCYKEIHSPFVDTRSMIHSAPLITGLRRSFFAQQLLAVEHLNIWGLEPNFCAQGDINRFAFMNYFQRPAVDKIKLTPTEKDCKKSHEILCAVVRILKPKEVWFHTKSTYEAFLKENQGNKIDDIEVSCEAWPLCSIIF